MRISIQNLWKKIVDLITGKKITAQYKLPPKHYQRLENSFQKKAKKKTQIHKS